MGNERDMELFLKVLLNNECKKELDVATFEEVGIPRNRGLIVKHADGSEFQITIERTR